MQVEQLPTATAMCHAATIVEAADQSLLVAWFGGTYEGHPDTAIWLVRQEHSRWGRPCRLIDVQGVAMFNPVLFRDRQDMLWLFYKVGPTVPAWTGFYIKSRDGGHSWSEPVMLPAGLLGPARNKPITLSNGEILCGTSRESWQNWACWVEIGSNDGQLWELRGPIAIPHAQVSGETAVSAIWDAERGQLVLPQTFQGIIQPTVWEYAPGRLSLLMRATQAVGVICRADSDDYGRTWSPVARTLLPNPNSALDAVRLTDGRIVLACNPVQEGRTPLSLLMSQDNGETWPWRLALETGAGEYSYPAIIQASDGRVHVVYTDRRLCIRHAALDISELETGV